MVKNIPVYKLQTMNIKQESIKTIAVDTNEFNGQSDLFAVQITNDDNMRPFYNNNDIVIFQRIDNIASIDHKDCIFYIGGIYIFMRATLQNNFLILCSHNSDNNQIQTYSKEQVEKLPIKVVGIAREKRTKL